MGTLVVIQRGADRAAFMSAMEAAGVVYEQFPGLLRHFHITSHDAAALPLAADPAVEAIEPDDQPVVGADQVLAIDANFSSASWALARIIRRRAPWPTHRLQFPLTTYFRSVRDGTGVDFYSFDTGIRATHDEFGGRATNVYEFYSSGGAGDDHGHGTGTSSCACGNTVGLARAASLFSFKHLNSSNVGTNTSFINAASEALLHYTSRTAPTVANMSFGGATSTINSAVADMIDAGIVVVAAAMNDSADLGAINEYPAESDPDVIVVGGIGAADIPYFLTVSGSNWGTRVDVSAPSQNIYRANIASDSAFTGGSWGTSFGCGYVSGTVACMLQGHSRLTGRAQVQAVKAKLMANATTGKLTNPNGWGITLPDRILYLDPNQTAPEPISGL